MVHKWFTGERDMRIEDDDVITIVSGLGRSYTSLMMKLLRDRGYYIHTDQLGFGSKHYPYGKFEHREVKSLHKPDKDVSWMENLYGKVVKIVFPYIRNIDLRHKYKVIVMKRPLYEIRQSIIDKMGDYKAIPIEVLHERWDEGIKFLEDNDINYIIVRHNEIRETEELPQSVIDFLEETT